MSALVMLSLMHHSSSKDAKPRDQCQDFVQLSSNHAASDSGSSKTDAVPCASDVVIPSDEKSAMDDQHHQANITQKEDIIPPKKMKKAATLEELQMVIHHFDIAQQKDMEDILSVHEPHVLDYRDKQYLKAQDRGITADSDDDTRLKILTDVVQFAFMTIEPPNEYTKKTDRKHFKEVGDCTATFAKEKGVTPSVALIYSALCHDIERFIPCTKCEYLPESVDKYRKQIIHGETSAKVACCLLKGAPVTKEEKEKIYEMIRHHDMPNPREDMVILDRTLVSGISDDLMNELTLLMNADSFSFFRSTIGFFIEFKSKKNSPDWIWQRVKVNIKRLAPSLRVKASKCIDALPIELKKKMAIDYDDLAQIIQ
eukprot:300639_1